ncbi:MAG TPA: rhomboid family intramembrane serine protease [Tepidisphaeraceae bacterium]|jgi:GlpG protein|nr:rhomboid family intramembrane serine protease [Tepidisphaeraceae bacterium]
MRRPPPITDFIKYPIVGGTIALAVGVSLAAWSGRIDVGSLYATVDIRRGQLWRVLTSTLPHVNFLHLAFNVYWTWVFGTLLEEVFGHARTSLIFVLLAVAGNGAEYAFLDGGVGLSGIGYGLFGLLWVLSRRDERFADAVDHNTVVTFVVWFFACIVMTVAGYPIGNVAHGVGAATGALLGWAISSSGRRKAATAAGLAVVVAGVLVGVTFARPWINFSKTGGYAEGELAYDALLANHDTDAIRWYRDATRMQPGIAGYWFNLGIAYERMKRNSEAAGAYRRAVDIEPNNPTYQATWRERKNWVQ